MRLREALLLLLLLEIFITVNSSADEAMSRHITSIGAVSNSAPILAVQIIRAADVHGIDHKLFAAIIAAESMFKADAYNAHSSDYGIAQINRLTAIAYGFNIERLQTDTQYNLYAGAHILAYFKRRYAKTEPRTWYCRYNVGTAKLEGKRLELCNKYIKMVQKYL